MDEKWGRQIEAFDKVRRRRECLHPRASRNECSPTIAKAHTVPVSALRLIARDGHVLELPKHPAALSKTEGIFSPCSVGVKAASTFTGFCGRHDNELFGPIENKFLQPCAKHAFLLMYRALCTELFAQEARLQGARARDENKWNVIDTPLGDLSSPDQVDFLKGCQEATARCLKDKQRLDSMLSAGNYSEVRFVFLKLGSPPEIMCSGLATPDFDFNGNRLQDVADWDTPLTSFYLSLVGEKPHGWAVFGWMSEDDHVAIPFVQSLLDRCNSTAVANGIVRMVFSCIENSFISPDWWDILDANLKDELVQLTRLAADPFLDNPTNHLAPGADVPLNCSIDRIEANCGITMPTWLN